MLLTGVLGTIPTLLVTWKYHKLPQIASTYWLAGVGNRNEVQVKMGWGSFFLNAINMTCSSKEMGEGPGWEGPHDFFWPDQTALQGLLFDDVLDRFDLWYHFSRHHRTAWGGESGVP